MKNMYMRSQLAKAPTGVQRIHNHNSNKRIKIQKLLLLVAALAISSANAAMAATVRMQLVHTDAGRGLTSHDLLHRMAQRRKARAERLLSDTASAPVTPGEIDYGVPDTEYLVHFAIGTPAQPVQLTLDSGSDLIWTQCQPCVSCFEQAPSYFNTSKSSTFAELSCHSPMCFDLDWSSCGEGNWGNHTVHTCAYTYAYADKSITTGQLAADTFTFAAAADGTGRASVPGLAFGCGLFNNGIFESNETGIAGFGRGALSLPSQLKVDNFSHCFTTITGSEPSTVLLGLPANLYSNTGGAVVQSTPLIQSSSAYLDGYYLSLKGITVGSKRLPIPESVFELKEDGTVIDSGTGITSLPQNAYHMVYDAFVAQVGLPVLNSTASSVTQLCFMVPRGAKPDVPKLVFHFEGETLDLPRENYMFDIQDAGGNFTCLAVNAGGDMTIIGNYQQQNLHVLYDLAGNSLSFVPALCKKL